MGIFSAMCTSNARLDGKTAVITGCNAGIGKECAKDFYTRGANVIMACRNIDKANEAMKEIKEQCKNTSNVGSLNIVKLDLGSLNSVRDCAKSLLASETKIDILLNNAGVMACPLARTEDGFEMQFGTNHLGHFLFTLLLIPKLMASDYNPARIVNVSSLAHERGVMDFDDLNSNKKSYSARHAYGQSKLANVLFTNELARRLKDNGVKNIHTYSLHPGVINTELGRHLADTYGWWIIAPTLLIISPFMKTPLQGAQTSIHCCVAEKAAGENSLYYKECAPTAFSSNAGKMDDAKKLWEMSLEMVGLKPDFNEFAQI